MDHLEDLVSFHEWVGSRMRSRGLSQRGLAAASGLDHSTVSRILRGQRDPSLETARALFAALREPDPEAPRPRRRPTRQRSRPLRRRLGEDGGSERYCAACSDWWPDDVEFFPSPLLARCWACSRWRPNLRKLDSAAIRAVLRLRKEFPMRVIAEDFGVSIRTLYRIFDAAPTEGDRHLPLA